MFLANLTRDPAMAMLHRQVDDLLQGFIGPHGLRRPFPALNVWERDGNLHVEAELPGLSLDDIEVLVEGDELTLKGERKLAHEGDIRRAERLSGKFVRTLTLPYEIDAERVTATLKDGVLHLELPTHERARRRRIEIKGE